MVEYITKNKLIERDDSGKVNYLLTARNIGAKLLGTYDEAKKAELVGIEVGEKYRDDFQRAEDTARHGIFHGLLLNEKGKMNMFEKLGFNYMNLKKDEDKTGIKSYIKNLVALENTGEESNIDVNNNKFSVALRRQMIAEGNPSEEDFVDRVVNIVQDLRKGKESPEINGFKLKLSLGLLDEPIRKRYKENILSGETPYSDELNPASNVGTMKSSRVPLKKPEELKFNKGGTAMEKQMEMSFMQEGGLKDDGMDRDPISGNEVPSGSLAEEVRDDIPAQLSDGEYVVPADVVRFFGVKFFEDLRMQAKMGLAQMENAGRIGGEPIEESADIIDAKDEAKIRNMIIGVNKGGVIHAAEGVLTESDIQADAIAKSEDPLGQFGFVGGSLGFPSRPVPTQKTFYHPDGRTYVVRYNADGSLANPNDVVYTESPWSETPPNIQQVQTNIEDAPLGNERESSDREISASDDPFSSVRPDTMQENRDRAKNALTVSFDRLKDIDGFDLTIDEYRDLPLSAKIGLIPAELGINMKKENVQAIIDNANNPTVLGALASALGGGVVGAVANAAKNIFTGLGEVLTFDSPNKTTQEIANTPISELGVMGRLDKALLGITQNKDGVNQVNTVTGLKDVNSKEGKEALKRIEKNRKKVQKDALDNHMKEVENLKVDITRAEEEAGRGDLDTVAQNEAFDRQMQEAIDIAQGTSGGGVGGNTGSAPQFGASSFGFGGGGGGGFSQPDSGPFFVNKGGLASKPKAKAKRKKNTKGLGTKPKAT